MSSSNSSDNSASVEELYLKEKKRSAILLASTVILAVFLAGSLLYSPSSGSVETAAIDETLANVQAQAQDGRGAGRGGQDITAFFSESGSVDQEAVDAFAERINQGGGGPGGAGADTSQFLERFILQITTAVESGELTQAQGDALNAAFSQIESSEI